MNLLYSLYFLLPNFARLGILGKAINKVLAIILKRIFDLFVPYYLKISSKSQGSGISSNESGKIIVVSLTSFPARISQVWISIETILRQSYKPNIIILWLAEDQFPDKVVPTSLTRLISRGLSIRFCEDLKSHKKYFFALKEFPDANIITLDDDLYYPKDVIKNIVDLNERYPNLIATNRAHRFTFRENVLIPYRKWDDNVTDIYPSHCLVQTGGAGTLYPPNCLHPDVFNESVIRTICFHADDLWLKMMAYMKDTMVVTNDKYNKDFITTSSTQKVRLVVYNVLNGGNDIQLKNICEHYSIDLSELNINCKN